MARDYCHNRVQMEGKRRDLFTCQICGSKQNVEGHHIIDVAFGGAPNVDNIVTLCHSCHVAAHNGKINIFKF